MSRYDHIVIGAGIMGSCTALQLAKEGGKVLLLEQFALPHTRGSSHGATRLIRSCYSDPFFAELMPDACRMWKALEEESGTSLIIRTGVLCMEKTRSESFQKSIENMQLYNPQSISSVDASELQEKYPMLRYPSDYSVFLDATGGVIRANKALSTIQDLFKKNGGHLWDSCRVLEVEPGEEVKVSTSNGYVSAPSLVICAGCWTGKILTPNLIPNIPLQPAAVKVFYWKEKDVGKYTFANGFPAFIDCTSDFKEIYGLPSVEYPALVKVCVHGGVPCDPDERDKAKVDGSLQGLAEEYVREHLPGLEATPSVIEDCMYTLTPDETFIADRLPNHQNIIIGCGFSGMGFKFSPVVGKLLCELATAKTPSHELSPFLLSRFMKDGTGSRT